MGEINLVMSSKLLDLANFRYSGRNESVSRNAYQITYPVFLQLLIHIHLLWYATCLCVKENREIGENEGPEKRKRRKMQV